MLCCCCHCYVGDDDSGPAADAAEQVVLDPNQECERLTNSSAAGCDILGTRVSPDGALVVFGLDASGTEQYATYVRNIGNGAMLLPEPILGTSGDYEWSQDSQSLFYVTRNATTNRPSKVRLKQARGICITISSMALYTSCMPYCLLVDKDALMHTNACSLCYLPYILCNACFLLVVYSPVR